MPGPSEWSAPREISERENAIETTTASPTVNARALDPISAQLPVLPPRDELALLSEPVEPNVSKLLSDARDHERSGANTPQVPRDEMRWPTSLLVVPRVRLETNRFIGEREESSTLTAAISPSPTSRARPGAVGPSPIASVRASDPGTEEAIRTESAERVINVTIGRVDGD